MVLKCSNHVEHDCRRAENCGNESPTLTILRFRTHPPHTISPFGRGLGKTP